MDVDHFTFDFDGIGPYFSIDKDVLSLQKR